MSIGWRFINGLVFGISHHYQLDFDRLEEEQKEGNLSEIVARVARVPVVFVHLGPIQLIVSW
jgi:hypothetical protein